MTWQQLINKNETNAELCPPQSCRNVPWKPPSPWTLSFSLHRQPQPSLIRKGRKEASEDCSEERPRCPETLPGQMRITRQGQPQQLPRDSSFLSTLRTERQLQPSQPAVHGGRTGATAIPLGTPCATAWTCRCFICCRQDSAAQPWLCSTWGRSYCSGSGAEWRFTAHGWTRWS